jgi:hypothetical protein
MGQWATRTRRGGNISLNMMTSATKFDPLTALVNYLNNVDATAFALGQFTSQGSGQTPTFIAQTAPRQLGLGFAFTIAGDNSLNYFGTVPGILNPDTASYS